MDQQLIEEISLGVATLTLNRPDRLAAQVDGVRENVLQRC
jgi:hypothetical protein